MTLESLVSSRRRRRACAAHLGDGERQQLAEVLELCEVPHVDGKKGSFSTKDYAQDLRRLLGKEELHGRAFESSQLLSIGAACGCSSTSTCSPTPTRTASGRWSGSSPRSSCGSTAARCARSGRPAPGEADKNASLLIFSQCKTAMGSRLLRKWLRQPLVNAHDTASATTWLTPSSTTRRCGWRSATSACRRWAATSTARSASSRAGATSGDEPPPPRRLLTTATATSPTSPLQDVVFLYQFVLKLPKLLQMLNSHDPASDDEAALVKRKFAAPLRVRRLRAVPPPRRERRRPRRRAPLEYIVLPR